MTATNGAGAAGAASANEKSCANGLRACACGSALSRKARTGTCRSCSARALSADPAVVARRTARMKTTINHDPAARARHSAACKEGAARRMADPVGHAQIMAAMAASPLYTSSWCPPAYRDLNEKMKQQRFSLAERRRIILSDVPGTPEHARRMVLNHQDAQRIRAAREKAQAY